MILKPFNALAGLTKERAEVGCFMEAVKTWENYRFAALSGVGRRALSSRDTLI